MRAAYYEAFGGPENVRIGERPAPVADTDHMLVRTQAAGVGIWDVLMMRGGRGPAGQASLPRIPGSEFAGTVEVAAGGFSAPDRVFCSLVASGGGRFPQFAAAPAGPSA